MPFEDEMTEDDHADYLDEIEDYLLDQTVPVPKIEFKAGDIQFWVEVIHRAKFDRSVRNDRKAIAMFSFSKAILDGLHGMTMGDGSAVVTEDERDGWLSVADILEIEAKRIRSVISRAKVRDPAQVQSIVRQVLTG